MNENQKEKLEQANELIGEVLAEDNGNVPDQAPADDILNETGRGQPFQPSDGE